MHDKSECIRACDTRRPYTCCDVVFCPASHASVTNELVFFARATIAVQSKCTAKGRAHRSTEHIDKLYCIADACECSWQNQNRRPKHEIHRRANKNVIHMAADRADREASHLYLKTRSTTCCVVCLTMRLEARRAGKWWHVRFSDKSEQKLSASPHSDLFSIENVEYVTNIYIDPCMFRYKYVCTFIRTQRIKCALPRRRQTGPSTYIHQQIDGCPLRYVRQRHFSKQ